MIHDTLARALRPPGRGYAGRGRVCRESWPSSPNGGRGTSRRLVEREAPVGGGRARSDRSLSGQLRHAPLHHAPHGPPLPRGRGKAVHRHGLYGQGRRQRAVQMWKQVAAARGFPLQADAVRVGQTNPEVVGYDAAIRAMSGAVMDALATCLVQGEAIEDRAAVRAHHRIITRLEQVLRTGQLNTVIDVWELNDHNHMNAGFAAV
eukprot:gene64676-88474_t